MSLHDLINLKISEIEISEINEKLQKEKLILLYQKDQLQEENTSSITNYR